MATSRSTPPRRTPAGRGLTARPGGTRTAPAGWSPLASVPTKYHTPIFIGLIFLSLVIFFASVIFGGKFFATNDNISWLSFLPYLDAMAAKGEHPFWIPYIFSGMPAYGAYLVTGDRWWDLSMAILGTGEKALGFGNYWLMRVIFHYFIYGVGMYLLMRSKKAARSTSLFVSMAAMFSTWVIIYIMIGHNTKISVLMTFPFLFLCMEKLLQRWSFLYAGLLILAVHLMVEGAHPQTAFYGLCAVGIYLLFELIGAAVDKSKDLMVGVVRAGLLMAVAGAFAYGMGLDRYQAIAEYTPYSTRGASAIIADSTNPSADQETEDGGHGYKYATDWSFSPEEMITFVVPSYFGFGKVDYELPDGRSQQVMSYWGQMPFTDAAHYMGIGVLILGIFGAWMNRKNRFVQALMVVGVFGLLLSFGRNFPLVFDFFYNVVPSFNKFRAPSQATVLLEFVFPLLAGFGIESLIAMHKSGDNPRSDKSILYGTYAFAAFCAIGLMAVNVARASYVEGIAQAAQEKGQTDLTQLQDFIFSNMQSDWMFAAFFGVGTLLLAYFYVKGRISPTAFKLGLFAILIFDLWRVDYRPMGEAIPQEQAFAVFQSTDVDAFLAQDTSQYRILDLTTQGPNYPARQFHQHILGYHAAKMRSYQDLLDVAGNGNIPTSPLAWNLLNTKYIIAPQPIAEGMQPVFQSRQKQALVFRNEGALPRAWFVNRVQVADPKTTLFNIRDNAFDPRDVAFVTKPLAGTIDPVGYAAAGAPRTADTAASADTTAPAAPAGGSQGRGTVSIASYEAHRILMNVEAPGNNFLVVSEMHYPPGWKATIDGKPAEIIQTNYLLRGLVIPPGKHTVEMTYVSEGFDTAKYTSLGLNLVMFALIGFGFMRERRRPEDADPEHDAPLIAEDDV